MRTIIPSITRVLEFKAELGECPLWSLADQCLYWLDIVGMTLNKFDPRNGINRAWPLPAAPGCFAFKEGGGGIIAAQDGIYEIDFADGHTDLICTPAHDPSRLRFNDGRTDRQGRLWVGTVQADMLSSNTDSAYYRYDGRSLDKVISPVGMANGTAFSPDGYTMYRAQTMDRLIFAYDYDPKSGMPSRERVFAVVPADLGLPDGAAVDSQGGYWIALPAPPEGGKSGIARYSPDGQLDHYFEVPVPMPTMVAFGGADLSTLFFTSGRLQAWVNYTVPASAGSLFAVATEFRGIPEVSFKYA